MSLFQAIRGIFRSPDPIPIALNKESTRDDMWQSLAYWKRTAEQEEAAHDRTKKDLDYWKDTAARSLDRIEQLEKGLTSHGSRANEWHKERYKLLTQIDKLTTTVDFDVLYLDLPSDRRDGSILNRATALYQATDNELRVVDQFGTWAITSNGVECLVEIFKISIPELEKDDWPIKIAANPKVNMLDFLRAFYKGRSYHHQGKYPSPDSILLGAELRRRVHLPPKRAAKYKEHIGEARPGYVYLFQCADIYKIGFSINPVSRLRAVRSDQIDIIGDRLVGGAELLCLHTIKTDNMRKAETRLHSRFAHRNYKREWFKLEPTDIEWITAQESIDV